MLYRLISSSACASCLVDLRVRVHLDLDGLARALPERWEEAGGDANTSESDGSYESSAEGDSDGDEDDKLPSGDDVDELADASLTPSEPVTKTLNKQRSRPTDIILRSNEDAEAYQTLSDNIDQLEASQEEFKKNPDLKEEYAQYKDLREIEDKYEIKPINKDWPEIKCNYKVSFIQET